MHKNILLKLFVLLMNDISTIRYVIIIIFEQDTLLIINNNKSLKCKKEYEYMGNIMVVEKEEFKNSNINMLLF